MNVNVFDLSVDVSDLKICIWLNVNVSDLNVNVSDLTVDVSDLT